MTKNIVDNQEACANLRRPFTVAFGVDRLRSSFRYGVENLGRPLHIGRSDMGNKYHITNEELGCLARMQHDLFRMVCEGALDAKQVLLGLRHVINAQLVWVPDLSAEELVAMVHCHVGLNHCDPNYAKYEFLRDERGKGYEVCVWRPHDMVETTAVCEYFRARGFDGNPAAFLTWVMGSPIGLYASIPPDDAQLFRCPETGALFAPAFGRKGSDRGLGLHEMTRDWESGWAFVGFRSVEMRP